MAKVCVIAKGLPGCGKSTFIKKVLGIRASIGQEAAPAWTVHSSDQVIEDYAKQLGKTYNDVWDTYKDTAEKIFWAKLDQAAHIFHDDVIFVDRTNLTFKSRKRIMDAVGPEYTFVCLSVFCSNSERAERNAARVGKVIPESIVDNMKKSIQVETYGEGFVDVYWVDTKTHTEENPNSTQHVTPKYVYDKLIRILTPAPVQEVVEETANAA